MNILGRCCRLKFINDVNIENTYYNLLDLPITFNSRQQSMNDRRLWTIQEDQIILELTKEHGFKKWTVVASEMNKIMGKCSRTSKQIRQRWHNHLDPNINKCPWTQQQQNLIFQAHKEFGSKWKEIAKLLVGRTDNSVKNHFYSTLRRSLRRINKYLGFKNSTQSMRLIKPSILSLLVESADKNFQAKMLVQRIFQFSEFKPSKTSMHSLESLLYSVDKLHYQAAIQKLVQFNNLYIIDKKQCLKIQGKLQINIQSSNKKTYSGQQLNEEVNTKIQQQNEADLQNNEIEQGYNDIDELKYNQVNENVSKRQDESDGQLEKQEKQFNFFEGEDEQNNSVFKGKMLWIEASYDELKTSNQPTE